MAERAPPSNVDAEREMLGTCLLRSSEIDGVADVRVTDLYLPEHRECWRAILAVRQRGDAVEPMTVASEMAREYDAKCGLMWLVGLLQFASVAGAQPAARHVVEASRLRQLIAISGQLQAQSYGDQVTADEIIAMTRRALIEIETSGSSNGPTHAGAELGKALEEVERRQRCPDDSGLPTGNTDFDAKIGTLHPGHLVIVAGLPGMGKSSYAQGVAQHVATRGNPCLLFNYEMPKQEQIERFLSATARVPAYSIKLGTLDYLAWQNIVTAGKAVQELPIYLDTRSLTISQIIGEARRWYYRHADDRHALVVVDYLQLVRTEGKKQNRERDVADISTGLKQLAMTEGMKITVMALSQLNRSVAKEGREPGIHDLRESGQIEADADMVIFPWRELIKDDEGKMRVVNGSGPCKIIVGKHRGGRTGSVSGYWEAPYMRFDNLIDPETGELRA